MREEKILKYLAVSMVTFGLILLSFMLHRLGFFEAIIEDTDFLLFVAAATYIFVGALFGLYSRQIVRMLRSVTGRRQVVISHSGSELEYVHKLRRELNARRIGVWSDADNFVPGEPVMDIYEKKIKEGDALLLFPNPGWEAFETDLVQLARGLRRKIVIAKMGDDLRPHLGDYLQHDRPEDPALLAEIVKQAIDS